MPIHTGSVAAAAAARATGVKAFKDSGPLSLQRGGGGKKVRWWGRKSEEWVEEREEVKAERKQVGDRAVER